MASITHARADLLSGGLIRLLDETVSTNDGQISYVATYCCLTSNSDRYAPSFRIGADPPIPSDKLTSANGFTDTPTLTNINTRSENGITYYDASYVSISAAATGTSGSEFFEPIIAPTPTDGSNGNSSTDAPGVIVAPNTAAALGTAIPPQTTVLITSEMRVFNGEAAVNTERFVRFRFDYIAKSITVEHVNGIDPSVPIPSGGLVSPPYNLTIEEFGGITYAAARSLARSGYLDRVIVSTRETYTSGGRRAISMNSTGVYVSP